MKLWNNIYIQRTCPHDLLQTTSHGRNQIRPRVQAIWRPDRALNRVIWLYSIVGCRAAVVRSIARRMLGTSMFKKGGQAPRHQPAPSTCCTPGHVQTRHSEDKQ